MRIIETKKYAQTYSNPLDGKTKDQARRFVNNKVVPRDKISGFFSDDAWQGVQLIWDAFDEAGLDWVVTESRYYPDKVSGHPMGGKIWYVEINFNNNKAKHAKLSGTITAAGAGSVEDPLSRYDITAYVW